MAVRVEMRAQEAQRANRGRSTDDTQVSSSGLRTATWLLAAVVASAAAIFTIPGLVAMAQALFRQLT